MSFMKKKSLSILKICQSLLVAKKGKGPFIYYVSFLFGHPSPLPKHIYSIESRVSKKRQKGKHNIFYKYVLAYYTKKYFAPLFIKQWGLGKNV